MTSMELRGIELADRRGRPVLDGFDLDLPEGSTTALCGPAGAGKSAVLRVLVGLTRPDAGDVLVDGHVVNAVGPRDRDLALVPQDYALHPRLDVHDNLAFASRLRRGHDKVALAERIDEVATALALDGLLDARPVHLDDAQRQRVSIGRALVRDALGYLFDEPFSAQSDRVRTHVRSVTTEWQREAGRTSLFTTSHPDEALTLADRVAVVHRGVVHQVGAPEEVYDRPADLFVAAFLGRSPMNLLPARRVGDRLVTPVADLPLAGPLASAVGDRELVVLGVRPEHCTDDAVAADGLVVTSRVDDVEWRGGTQLVHLGYDLEDDVQHVLEGVEDTLDFDLFQQFFVAELAPSPRRRPGATVRVGAPLDRVLVFDPATGRRLGA